MAGQPLRQLLRGHFGGRSLGRALGFRVGPPRGRSSAWFPAVGRCRSIRLAVTAWSTESRSITPSDPGKHVPSSSAMRLGRREQERPGPARARGAFFRTHPSWAGVPLGGLVRLGYRLLDRIPTLKWPFVGPWRSPVRGGLEGAGSVGAPGTSSAAEALMPPPKDRRPRCRHPQSPEHCASLLPCSGSGRLLRSGSQPVRLGARRNGA